MKITELVKKEWKDLLAILSMSIFFTGLLSYYGASRLPRLGWVVFILLIAVTYAEMRPWLKGKK
jgi:hypothetical protein